MLDQILKPQQQKCMWVLLLFLILSQLCHIQCPGCQSRIHTASHWLSYDLEWTIMSGGATIVAHRPLTLTPEMSQIYAHETFSSFVANSVYIVSDSVCTDFCHSIWMTHIPEYNYKLRNNIFNT